MDAACSTGARAISSRGATGSCASVWNRSKWCTWTGAERRRFACLAPDGDTRVRRHVYNAAAIAVTAVLLAGCTAGIAFRKGYDAARVADWDTAVVHYREAVQADPDKPEYKIALERAMLEASRIHYSAGKQAESAGDLDVAVREYRHASEYDPTNRSIASKVAELDQTIRDRIEAN